MNWQRTGFDAAPVCLAAMALLLLAAASSLANDKLKALIIDGQNNHADWPKTTMMMKHYLEQEGGFQVDIARTRYTWNGKKRLEEFPLEDGRVYQDLAQPRTDPDFKPDFEKYDVVLSNFGYNCAPWPQSTRDALDRFVKKGGGLVIVHAADNSFADWKAFNQMIGLGGWGGRNEKNGPYVYLTKDGDVVRDPSPGPGGGHGPQHEFQIVVRDDQHPITRDLPKSWMHAKDELYHGLRGPADNMTILATAFSSRKFGGTERHEPMLMVIDYGQGRVFHTPMGHADYSMECVGFITILVRGTQWAAASKVPMIRIPEDFPKPYQSRSRRFQPEALRQD